MKVIYLKTTGGNKWGDVKEVAEGYARNFLLPQQLALLATPENIAKIKTELGKQDKNKQNDLAEAKLLADKIRGKKIEIKGKANEIGKLYASISEADIKAGFKRLGFNLGQAKILNSNHLKEVGEYDLKLDFGHGINSNIIVSVKV